MIKWKLIIFGMMILIAGETAFAQASPDYDAAARHADRAIRAYKDLQQQKLIDQGDEAMAAAMINLHVCKPMHDQTGLSRRQYIASMVKGRARQKAVAERCAEQELWYASICKPRTSLDDDLNTVIFIEPSCPVKWESWPPPPPIFSTEYYQRIAEIKQLYQ